MRIAPATADAASRPLSPPPRAAACRSAKAPAAGAHDLIHRALQPSMPQVAPQALPIFKFLFGDPEPWMQVSTQGHTHKHTHLHCTQAACAPWRVCERRMGLYVHRRAGRRTPCVCVRPYVHMCLTHVVCGVSAVLQGRQGVKEGRLCLAAFPSRSRTPCHADLCACAVCETLTHSVRLNPCLHSSLLFPLDCLGEGRTGRGGARGRSTSLTPKGRSTSLQQRLLRCPMRGIKSVCAGADAGYVAQP